MAQPPYFFQIGFNKCATTAMSKLFQNSGYRSIHGNARRTWRRIEPNTPRVPAQLIIHENMRAGLPALTKYERFFGFFDLFLITPDLYIENFKRYYILARDYPNAKFILNVRNKSDWLLSRQRHKDGRTFRQERKFRGLRRNELVRYWSDDWDRHLDNVKTFFAAEADRLLVFDIDTAEVGDLVDFCAPEIELDTDHWERHRETDALAETRQWRDKNNTAQQTQALLPA